jgi:hypothetical protein
MVTDSIVRPKGYLPRGGTIRCDRPAPPGALSRAYLPQLRLLQLRLRLGKLAAQLSTLLAGKEAESSGRRL